MKTMATKKVEELPRCVEWLGQSDTKKNLGGIWMQAICVAIFMIIRNDDGTI